MAILHAIPDADAPHAIVARIMDAPPARSFLALSHAGRDLLARQTREGLEGIGTRSSQQQYTLRDREQVARFKALRQLEEDLAGVDRRLQKTQ